MELDITDFVRQAVPSDFFASVAERGQNAGPETWQAANREAGERPLLATREQIEEVRNWFGGFGAWDDEERAAWSDEEVNALLIQYISGDLREIESLVGDIASEDFDETEYERPIQEGTIGGNAFRGTDGRIYYYVGS